MSFRTIYILFNNSGIPQLEKYLPQISENEILTIVLFDETLGKRYKDQKNVRACHINDFVSNDDIEEFTRAGIAWAHQWGQDIKTGDKSLPELFAVDQCSLWWISGYLYLYSDFITIISHLKIIEQIYHKAGFDRVILPNVLDFSPLSSQLSLNDPYVPYKIVHAFCRQKEIDYQLIVTDESENRRWRRVSFKNKLQTIAFRKFLIYLIELYRKWLVKFNLNKNAIEKFKKADKRILILSPSRNWGKIFDLVSTEKIDGDTKLGYLYQNIANDTCINCLGVDCNSLPNGEFNILKKKLVQDRHLTWLSIESLATLREQLDAHRRKNKYAKKAREMMKRESFSKSFDYNEVNFYSILKNRLDFVFDALLPHGAVVEAYYQNLYKKLRPHLIIATYETGLHGRAATSAAFSQHIPIMGIQHGKIHASHPQYINPTTSGRENIKLTAVPIADGTAVFGQYTKSVLINDSAYPENKVYITGQLSADAIQLSERLYDRDAFNNLFGLVNNLKIVSLLSQNFDNPGDMDRFFRIVCEGLNRFSNLNFVIKLHPRQNVEAIAALVAKYYHQPNTVKILKAVDLYEVIYCSDIIVTGNSTVGVEAMMFGKPLITVEGFKYSMGYAESGASIGVLDADQMRIAIQNISDDPDKAGTLVEHAQKYVNHHLYKIDGQVRQRILEKGLELIEKFSHYNE